MYSIVKIFKIKGPTLEIVDIATFLNTFYEKLLAGAHVNGSIPVENFISVLQQIKLPFQTSNKFISQNTQMIDGNNVWWQADFDSIESYQEYKNELFNNFGTDFHTTIDTPDISLEIVP